jgi:hypothetical protein
MNSIKIPPTTFIKETLKIALLFVFSFFLFSLLLPHGFISAQTQVGDFVIDVGGRCVPQDCYDTGEFVPDTQCVLKQFQTPEARDPDSPEFCCENKCIGTESDTESAFTELINVFGTRIYVTTQARVAALINLVLSSILGLISAYTLISGILLAAYKLPNTVDPEEISQIQKSITTMIVGFILAWSFIFIIQFISTLLGIGNLAEMIVLGEPDEVNQTTITIT